MFELRPYQKKFIDDIRQSFARGNRRVCGVMPCGAGKTLATADMTKKSAAKGKRVVFMVHRKELIEQTSKTFSAMGIKHGIVSSQVEPAYELPVQIASVQTLKNRLDKIAAPDFLIVDECHHIEAETYKTIVKQWDCHLLGLTATPIRMGGKTLHDSFDALVIGPSINELIAHSYLADYEYFASTDANLDGLQIRAGEYTNESMSRTLDRMEVIGDVVQSYITHALGRKAICYCINVEHSGHIADTFNARGVRAAHLDGNFYSVERADIIDRFRRGEIDVLCNVELFGEGFDVPDMDCVILARPTKSLTLFIQQAMRPLRVDPLNPDKKAIILDHVKNFERFGALMKNRQWSLDENPIEEPEEAPTKLCPNCFEEIALGARVCPECGYEFDFEDIKQSAGKMVKIYASDEKLTPLVKYFRSVGYSRGYKRGWAAFKALEYARNIDDCYEIANFFGYKKGWGFHKWRDIEKYRSNPYRRQLSLPSLVEPRA